MSCDHTKLCILEVVAIVVVALLLGGFLGWVVGMSGERAQAIKAGVAENREVSSPGTVWEFRYIPPAAEEKTQ